MTLRDMAASARGRGLLPAFALFAYTRCAAIVPSYFWRQAVRPRWCLLHANACGLAVSARGVVHHSTRSLQHMKHSTASCWSTGRALQTGGRQDLRRLPPSSQRAAQHAEKAPQRRCGACRRRATPPGSYCPARSLGRNGGRAGGGSRARPPDRKPLSTPAPWRLRACTASTPAGLRGPPSERRAGSGIQIGELCGATLDARQARQPRAPPGPRICVLRYAQAGSPPQRSPGTPEATLSAPVPSTHAWRWGLLPRVGDVGCQN